MKKSSIFVLCLLLVCCLCVATGCSGAKPASITITSANNATEIKTGETLQLTAKVNPDDASQDVVWSTNNDKVATVSASGLVTAIAEGNVVITATSAADSSVSKNFALVVKYQASGGSGSTTPTDVRISATGNVTDVTVGNTLKLTAEVRPATASQDVVWSSGNTAVATVANDGTVTGVAEGSAVITATCKDVSTVTCTITISVVSAQHSYETMEYCTHAEYMTAEKGSPLKVKGVVTYLLPVSEGKVCYYVQNGEDGYYIYNQDVANYPVELGSTYAIGGTKYYKNGVNEIQKVEYCVKLTEALTATTVELAGKNASSKDDMSVYHGAKVHATAQIKKLASDYTKAYSITIAIDSHETTIYVNPKSMSDADFSAITDKFKGSAVGSTIEVTGVMSAFGYGSVKPQILVFSADEITAASASPAQKVALAKENISIDTYLVADAATITLPTTTAAFDDVTIAWASDTEAVITAAGAVTHPTTDTVVTLTATISCDTASDTASFKVYVTGTQFNGTKTVGVTFDEDEVVSPGAGSYGASKFKGSYLLGEKDSETYEDNTVEIGGHHWLLWNAMVCKDNNDHVTGAYGVRTQANSDAAKTGRVQLMEAGSYDYIQFDTAVYSSNALGIQLAIEYKLDGSDEWTTAYTISVNTYSATTVRFILPAGTKTVAISVVPDTGARVNIDNIELGTIGE